MIHAYRSSLLDILLYYFYANIQKTVPLTADCEKTDDTKVPFIT